MFLFYINGSKKKEDLLLSWSQRRRQERKKKEENKQIKLLKSSNPAKEEDTDEGEEAFIKAAEEQARAKALLRMSQASDAVKKQPDKNTVTDKISGTLMLNRNLKEKKMFFNLLYLIIDAVMLVIESHFSACILISCTLHQELDLKETDGKMSLFKFPKIII